MKKRSEREVNLLLYRSRKKTKRRNSASREGINSIKFRKVKCRFGNNEFDAYGIPIETPVDFSLQNNSSDVLQFLENIREYCYPPLTQKRPRSISRSKRWIGHYVNFTSIQHISTAAALVLAAEFYRLKESFPTNPNQPVPRLGLVDFHNWSKQSIGTLYHLGFLNLLEVILNNNEVTENCDEDRHILEFMTGDNLEPESIRDLKEGLAQLTTKLDTAEKIKLGIYDGLCEAMTNTMDHAYQDAEKHLKLKILNGRWWMTGSVTKCGSEIEVVFFDQGISIPRHLTKNTSERIRARINKFFDSQVNNDAMMIKAAMEISRTETKESNRGKGLAQIQKLIELSHKGKLRILSKKGEYIYSYEEGKKPYVKTNNLEGDIGGTLIHWHLIVRAG